VLSYLNDFVRSIKTSFLFDDIKLIILFILHIYEIVNSVLKSVIIKLTKYINFNYENNAVI
jgi:hypothetical protein